MTQNKKYKKLEAPLVDDILKIQDNYLGNGDVIKAISNALTNLALRKPKVRNHMELLYRGVLGFL